VRSPLAPLLKIIKGARKQRGRGEMRISTLRLVTIALLILLALAVFFSFRTLRRLPNVVVYFIKSEETSFTLSPAYRRESVNGLEQHLTAALQRLIEGPNSAEEGRGLSSAVPETTKLLGLTLQDKQVTVNLSRDFEAGGGIASIQGRLQQVFYTLTQPSDVEQVRLQIEGEDVSVFSGEGLLVDNPWTRPTRDTLPSW
jgi:spore germination protein GerM